MAVYYPAGCDVDLSDHVCDPCEAFEKGRISDVAFIKSTFEFTDPTDPTEWRTGINAHDIIIIPGITGSYDGGAPQEGPGYGRQATILLGYDFSANFKDPNYKTNCAFYNTLKNARGYRFAFRSETQVHITTNTVAAFPKNPISEDLNSNVEWNVDVKWKDKDLPCPYDVPPGIFDCFSVAP